MLLQSFDDQDRHPTISKNTYDYKVVSSNSPINATAHPELDGDNLHSLLNSSSSTSGDIFSCSAVFIILSPIAYVILAAGGVFCLSLLLYLLVISIPNVGVKFPSFEPLLIVSRSSGIEIVDLSVLEKINLKLEENSTTPTTSNATISYVSFPFSITPGKHIVSVPILFPSLSGNLSAPIVWLSASSLSTFIPIANNHEQLVSVWPNLTPSQFAASQPNAEMQPTFRADVINGLPVVTFNGLQSLIGAAIFGGRNNTSLDVKGLSYSIQIVLRVLNQGSRDGCGSPIISSGESSSEYGLCIFGNLLRFVCPGGSFTSHSAIPFDQPFLISLIYDGNAEFAIYLDGMLMSASPMSVPFHASSVSSSLSIGNRKNDNNIIHFQRDIAELLIWDTIISSSQRSRVDQLLAAQYGIKYQITSSCISPLTELVSICPLFWLSASSFNESTATDTKISVWSDLTSNRMDAIQTNEFAQPSFVEDSMNGFPAIRFSGSQFLVPNSSSFPWDEWTIIVVFQVPHLPVHDINLVVSGLDRFCGGFPIVGAGVGLDYFWHSLDIAPAGTIRVSAGTTSAVCGSSTLPIPIGNIPVIATITTSAYSRKTSFYIDGITAGTINYRNGGSLFTGGNMSVGASNVPTDSQIAAYLTGDIAELILFDRVISASDQENLERMFIKKYNISYFPSRWSSTTFDTKYARAHPNYPFDGPNEVLITNQYGSVAVVGKGWCSKVWCRVLSQTSTRLATVACVGDSITVGYGASSILHSLCFARASLMQEIYGDGGSGLQDCSQLGPLWQTGCVTDRETYYQILVRGRYVEIRGVSNCALNWSIDNGVTQTAFHLSSQGRTTITLQNTDLSQIYVFALTKQQSEDRCEFMIDNFRATNDNGIVFDRYGRSGALGTTQAEDGNFALMGGSKCLGCEADLVIYSFGVNDNHYLPARAGRGLQYLNSITTLFTSGQYNSSVTDILFAIPCIAGFGHDYIPSISANQTLSTENSWSMIKDFMNPLADYAYQNGFAMISETTLYSTMNLNSLEAFGRMRGFKNHDPVLVHPGNVGIRLYAEHELFFMSGSQHGSLPHQNTYRQPITSNLWKTCVEICASSNLRNRDLLCQAASGSLEAGPPSYGCNPYY